VAAIASKAAGEIVILSMPSYVGRARLPARAALCLPCRQQLRVRRDPMSGQDQADDRGDGDKDAEPLTAGLRRRAAWLELLCPEQAGSRGADGHTLASAACGVPRATAADAHRHAALAEVHAQAGKELLAAP